MMTIERAKEVAALVALADEALMHVDKGEYQMAAGAFKRASVAAMAIADKDAPGEVER